MEDMARLAVMEHSIGDVDQFNKIVHELLRHITEILDNPHEYDLRAIKSDILKDALKYDDYKSYLSYIGFRSNGTELHYPKEDTLTRLRLAQTAIERKICFVYGSVSRSKSTLNPTKPTALKPVNVLNTDNLLLQKIEKMFNDVLMYEDEDLLEMAREQIPLVSLQLMALERMRKIQRLVKNDPENATDLSFDVALLMDLLCWFKNKFFKWVDQPECEGCGGKTTFSNSVNVNAEKEVCQMEVYNCVKCGVGAKFVRYNDPRTLLRTRRGRCGEWANCFALFCRALGYDTRFVYDTTDHVWCEVFDYDTNSWLHVDPCEGKFNTPLMYSVGWGKKLSYVIAVSRDDLQDVTWRYTKDHKEVLARRKECTEDELVGCIMTLRAFRHKDVSVARRRYLNTRTLQELVRLMLENAPPKRFECQGRVSGSRAWREKRGEAGGGAYRSSSGSHPIRHTFEFRHPGDYDVRYHAADDKYRLARNGTVLKAFPSWTIGIYQADNIFRKVEEDWKKAYLAREEEAEYGFVSWRVGAAPGLRMQEVRVRGITALFDSGRIDWSLKYDDRAVANAHFDNEQLHNGVRLDRPCKMLVIRADFSGGSGEVAWQHAQLARQSLNDTEPSFEIHITVVPDE